MWCATDKNHNDMCNTCLDSNKVSNFMKLTQLLYVHKNHYFLSIPGDWLTNCLYPVHFMAVACQECTFSWRLFFFLIAKIFGYTSFGDLYFILFIYLFIYFVKDAPLSCVLAYISITAQYQKTCFGHHF